MVELHVGLDPGFLKENSDLDPNPDQNWVTYVYPQRLTSKKKDNDCSDPTMTQEHECQQSLAIQACF